MYLIKTPNILQRLFPHFTWRIPSTGEQEKVLYLTFDDGPIPGLTPWVLEQLAAYSANATFFCVGDNVRKQPVIFQDIVQQGHSVGNHTYHHLDGWATENIPYFHDLRKCAQLTHSTLFRPPYGRLKPRQAQFLLRHYHIIMWDVLSADFDPSVSPLQCSRNVLDSAGPGSVVVFHDNYKAEENLRYALPRVLAHFSEQGYRFEAIRPELLSTCSLTARTA
jgi:peptidoglycan/xylan/chitin deacetylase (PgdA/CDA1 family)